MKVVYVRVMRSMRGLSGAMTSPGNRDGHNNIVEGLGTVGIRVNKTSHAQIAFGGHTVTTVIRAGIWKSLLHIMAHNG